MPRVWLSDEQLVAYLGPPATHSHQAALSIAFPVESLIPKHSIQDVFLAVQSSAAAYGVVPYENSTFGSVTQTLDAFADREACLSDVSIVAEIYLPVQHYLVGHREDRPEAPNPSSGESTPTLSLPTPAKPRARPMVHLQHIKRIYSHPQAFGQCQAFLSTYLRGADCLEAPSTARAAEIVAHDGSKASAAISTAIAATVHKLSVLARGIEDRDDNCTRFFIISNAASEAHPSMPSFQRAMAQPPQELFRGQLGLSTEAQPESLTGRTESPPGLSERPPGANSDTNSSEDCKVLISFTLDQSAPGALVKALLVFKDLDLNLTNLGNRPSKIRAWHYIFFVEFETKRIKAERAKQEGMQRLREIAENCKWHGTWLRQNMSQTEPD